VRVGVQLERIVVMPRASVAAIIRFSVPVTEIFSK